MEIEYNDLSELKQNCRIKDFDGEYDMFKNKIDKMLSKHKDCTPIFITITGSTSYGLDLSTSDLDGKGIYVQDLDSILSDLKLGQANTYFYQPQITTGEKTIDGKNKEDIVLYELGRFLELLQNNNPDILTLFNIPNDCVVYKHPIWDELIEVLRNSNLLSKKCYYTFENYAHQQIKKATGLNKNINNPIDINRKTPVDFCHVIFEDNSTMLLRQFLEREKIDQLLCGLVKIPHARDLFSMYYDEISAKSFSKYIEPSTREEYRLNRKNSGETMGLGYKGIMKSNENNEEVSNEIRVSSVPQGEKKIALISYNKDGYMTYCKAYKEFWGENGWMKVRNEERYNDNISSGQNYDGKNMSHCLRLLYMAKEISEGKGIIVRRSEDNRKELLSVKKGEWSYETIIAKCEELTFGLKEAYEDSDLPETVDYDKIVNILNKFRKKVYGL